jgi:hypothetical protein
MTKQQRSVAIWLLKTRLGTGGLSKDQFDAEMSKIETLAIPAKDTPIEQPSEPPIDDALNKTDPEEERIKMLVESIDAEKAKLSNSLVNVPVNQNAKHIVDKILDLRAKRKEAYTTDRQRLAAAAQSPINIHREAENLRISLLRWKKQLQSEQENQTLKEKIANGEAAYRQLRSKTTSA